MLQLGSRGIRWKRCRRDAASMMNRDRQALPSDPYTQPSRPCPDLGTTSYVIYRRAYFVLGPFCVGADKAPAVPHAVPGGATHFPFTSLCCPQPSPQAPTLLSAAPTSTNYKCTLYKCAHKQTHTTVVSEVAVLHPHIEAHTDNLARNHLTVCSIRFAALYGFRGEAIEAT